MIHSESLLLTLLLAGGLQAQGSWGEPRSLKKDQAVITVVGTNDIHGRLDPGNRGGDRRVLGGMEWLAGYVRAIRSHHDRHYGEKGHVILLDGGDAAQGTLISNYSEGKLMARVMSRIGYTAGVPGNHAYDFGPAGWRDDVVVPGATDTDPLGALRQAAAAASFPFLGTNVTAKVDGQPIDVMPHYLLVPGPFGRRIAVFGLENPHTGNGSLTPGENVAGIVFDEGTSSLARYVNELESSGKADVFVMCMHEGDGGTSRGMGEFLEKLPGRSSGKPLLDAVIAGHSHALNNHEAGGIPYVQSADSGRMFGIIQLLVQRKPDGRLEVLRDRTFRKEGIPIVPEKGEFMGEGVDSDPEVERLVEAGRREVAEIAGRRLGKASGAFPRTCHRIADSPMGNLVVDMMRRAASTDVALINAGDVREGLKKGDVTYADLYAAIPKNLRLVEVEAMPVEKVVRNLERSIRSCGVRGALQVSGLTVTFTRSCMDCENLPGGEDRQSKLIRVVTDRGRVLLDREKNHVDGGVISVATTDFVMAGGSGYPHFKDMPLPAATVHLRDAIADQMEALGRLDPGDFAQGRYVNLSAR